MARCFDRTETDLLVEPIEQEICRRPVIEVAGVASVLPVACVVIESAVGVAQADAVDLAMQASLRGIAHLIYGELDAR